MTVIVDWIEGKTIRSDRASSTITCNAENDRVADVRPQVAAFLMSMSCIPLTNDRITVSRNAASSGVNGVPNSARSLAPTCSIIDLALL